MKTGDIVMIYEDPVTCLISEGTAKLVKHSYNIHMGAQGKLEVWDVLFPGEDWEKKRRILVGKES